MPRPPLPLGTWGRIRRKQVAPRQFQARARFRDHDGRTRDVEARGSTAGAAERALLEMLRDRAAAPSGNEITRDTRFSRLAEMWLDEIIAEGRLAPQTINRYEDNVRNAILPALGNLRLREAASVGRLDRFLKTIAKDQPGKARHVRNVLGQILAMAVRHDAIPTNPVRDVGRLRKKRSKARALTIDDLHRVRATIRQWQRPDPRRSGPRRTNDLAHIFDMLLATGARIGEVLALRWSDLDLTAAKPTATISGTLVYVRGKGTFRQDWTKSEAGYRAVTLPRFAVDMLLSRKVDAPANAHDAVFPSRKGTWLSPHNVRRQWREARTRTNLDWVTPHTFRKTVATLIDREADTKTAAAQLGHASEEITNTYYIDRPHLAPDSSDLLEKFAPDSNRTAV